MNPLRFLVVEDERDARDALVQALVRAGHTAIGAASLAETQSLLERFQIDTAIVDLRLGADDRAGLEVVSVLRALPVPPPVVVVTAFADVSKVKEALNRGAAYLLEKPFTTAAILEVAERLVSEPPPIRAYAERALARVPLTEKEHEVALLLLKGLTSREIAGISGNSERTIRQHVTQIYAKCGVSSRAEFFHYLFPS